MTLRIGIHFTNERLALFFARLARRLTNHGFADDHLSEAIKYIKAGWGDK